MALSQEDRIAFSLNIVSATEKIKSFDSIQANAQIEIDKLLKIDTANKNLFDPVNSLIDSYHSELSKLDGIVRYPIVEQNIQDSAKKIIKNYFSPNDITTVVPSLSSVNNVWTKIFPFAITYCIGKDYVETFGSTQKESDLISPVLSLITSAMSYTDIQNTTGQHCVSTGTCSLPAYTDQPTCVLNGGIWTPGPDSIESYPDVQTLKTNLVNAVNSLKSFLLTEASSIVTNDPDSSNQSLNNAAINNINNIIIPAINTWLAYSDFNTSHGQTTCVGFNGYNSNLLAPTKLHSVQLSALQSALITRSSFITTRTSQIVGFLGNISQNLTTGELISGTGLYGKRYNFLLLRLHALDGSLSKLTAMQGGKTSQDSIKNNILSTKNTYMTIVPTSILKAPGNGTNSVSLVDVSFLNPGDTVYLTAENQEELLRAVKSINGDTVILNDIVPAKFRPSEKARLYKDIS